MEYQLLLLKSIDDKLGTNPSHIGLFIYLNHKNC